MIVQAEKGALEDAGHVVRAIATHEAPIEQRKLGFRQGLELTVHPCDPGNLTGGLRGRIVLVQLGGNAHDVNPVDRSARTPQCTTMSERLGKRRFIVGRG